MTPKEAIDVLEDRQTCRECVHTLNNKQEFENACDECDMAFGMAYDALKKQIPKNPVFHETKYICPCGSYVKVRKRYCGTCGQALDWSDKE